MQTILIAVEDQMISMRLGEELLEQGYSIRTISDLWTLVQTIKKNRWDLILLDEFFAGGQNDSLRNPCEKSLWPGNTFGDVKPIASGCPSKKGHGFSQRIAIRTREGGMKSDIFGNLMEWGGVLEKLEQLRDSKTLDDHQAGLVRILRYPRNWRLREAVLRAIRGVNQPTEELLRETLNLALNEELYVEARTMAVHALADLMTKGRKIHTKNELTARSRVMQKMEVLMSDTHSPLLREGIESFFKKLANRKIVPVSSA